MLHLKLSYSLSNTINWGWEPAVFVQSAVIRVLLFFVVVEEFAGLVQDKSSVEDFVLWIENILERCIRKVCSCFTPTYISKHGYLPRVLRECLLLTKVDIVSYPDPSKRVVWERD